MLQKYLSGLILKLILKECLAIRFTYLESKLLNI